MSGRTVCEIQPTNAGLVIDWSHFRFVRFSGRVVDNTIAGRVLVFVVGQALATGSAGRVRLIAKHFALSLVLAFLLVGDPKAQRREADQRQAQRYPRD